MPNHTRGNDGTGYLQNLKNAAAQIFAASESVPRADPDRIEADVVMMNQMSRLEVKNYIDKILPTSFGPEIGPRIIFGARYDVQGERRGADATASGVAGLLEIARMLDSHRGELRTRIDLVAFGRHGSADHARSLRDRSFNVKLMIHLDSIGYYDDGASSQRFPLPALRLIYPSAGNFIAVVSESHSTFLLRKIKKIMQKHSRIDVQTFGSLASVPGINMSMYRHYANQGFPTVMLTDTSVFRNPNWASDYDTPETLNYEKISEVLNGAVAVALGF